MCVCVCVCVCVRAGVWADSWGWLRCVWVGVGVQADSYGWLGGVDACVGLQVDGRGGGGVGAHLRGKGRCAGLPSALLFGGMYVCGRTVGDG